MATEVLIVESHVGGAWHAAAELRVFDPARGAKSRTTFAYLDDYIAANAMDLGTADARAVSERFPLDFEVWTRDEWPPFLLDMVPAGAARRWWTRRLNARTLSEAELDYVLLRDHTIAPIGHMRIAQSEVPVHEPIPFSKEEVCRRDVGFLDYAAEVGAAIGGATGAGGDAPKVLLCEDSNGNVYPDGTLADEDTAACWLVKWPRGRDTDRDRVILHTEHLYAHALAELGVDVRPGEWRQVEDGMPSLWLPRFDRVISEEGLERRAVESFYSLAGVTQPGATVFHQTFLEELEHALRRRDQLDAMPAIVREYLRRDLLDVVLGNTDNHGRNRAVVRSSELRLAPVYDVAPMAMDPEGVTRTTRWREHERAGHIDWYGVCAELDRWGEPGEMEASLRRFASRLVDLPTMLREAGISEDVMAFPRIPLGRLPQTLHEWRLT